MSRALAASPIGVHGQMGWNVLLAFIGSVTRGDSIPDIIINTVAGGAAGYFGGPGAGHGGFYMSEALRFQRLVGASSIALLKGSVILTGVDFTMLGINRALDLWRSRDNDCTID